MAVIEMWRGNNRRRQGIDRDVEGVAKMRVVGVKKERGAVRGRAFVSSDWDSARPPIRLGTPPLYTASAHANAPSGRMLGSCVVSLEVETDHPLARVYSLTAPSGSLAPVTLYSPRHSRAVGERPLPGKCV